MELQPKTKRGFLFLEIQGYEQADSFFEEALNDNPEDSYAYIGKLLIDLNLKSIDDLNNQLERFDNNRNYELAYRFADDELKSILDNYSNNVINNINIREEKKREAKYIIVLKRKEEAKAKQDYINVINDLQDLGNDYKDVEAQIADCNEKITECDYTETLSLLNETVLLSDDENKLNALTGIIGRLNSFNGYKDSKAIAEKLQNQVNQIKVKLEEERAEKELQEKEAQAARKRAKKKKTVKAITISVLTILIIGIIFIAISCIYVYSEQSRISYYISLNKPSMAYDYYSDLSYKPLFSEDFERIVDSSVKNEDFDTLFEIYSENDKDKVAGIIERSITVEEYDRYYNAAVLYCGELTKNNIESYFRELHRLVGFLPEKYRNVSQINSVYEYMRTTYFDFKTDCYDLAEYCSFKPLNDVLVDSDFLVGNWESQYGSYFYLSKNGDVMNCQRNFPSPDTYSFYDYFRFEDGKYVMVDSADKNDTLNCFEIQIVGKNEIHITNYKDNKIYKMYRQ